MLRVYLDQNKWVDMLKARVKHPEGERFADIFALASEAATRGWVSFPLSQYHAMETQHRRDTRSRNELAITMIELSRWQTMAPQHDLLAAEIDHALHARFRRPIEPRSVRVFGVGASHMFGRPIGGYTVPAELPLTPEQRAVVEVQGRALMQYASLAGHLPGMKVPDTYTKALEAGRDVARRFARDQEELRDTRRPDGWHRGDRGRRIASVDVFAEYENDFNAALRRAYLSADQLYQHGAEGLEEILTDVPIAYAHRELRRLRHEASQRTWEENDLIDLAALAPAVVYCDVVVTERQWAALIRRAKLDLRYDTVVLSDTCELMAPLLGAGVI
jgi:hypothetical protein